MTSSRTLSLVQGPRMVLLTAEAYYQIYRTSLQQRFRVSQQKDIYNAEENRQCVENIARHYKRINQEAKITRH